MQEIKFRAWHEGNKDFIYATPKSIWMNGWSCCEALESPKLPKERNGIFTTQEALEGHSAFEPNADWEQFTGLLDKNGKDLDWWEGDLFKHHVTDYLLALVFEDGCFWFKTGTGQIRYKCYDVMEWGALPEKVGNIHENPELLHGIDPAHEEAKSAAESGVEGADGS